MPPTTPPPVPFPFADPNRNPWVHWAFEWFDRQPIVAALLLLMLIDVVCGIFLSFAKKSLSSTVSWRGMSKKAIMLLIVGLAAVLEPFAQGIPLSRLVAMFYIFTEALSILENAAAAGVPLPGALVDALAKLKESQRAARVAGTTTVKLEVHAEPVEPTNPHEVQGKVAPPPPGKK